MKKKQVEEAIKRLHEEISNIADFYNDNDLRKILKKMDDVELDKVADAFVEAKWEKPIRRCSWCGDLMNEGYLLGNEYACCDECRNEIYKRDNNVETDEEAYRLYLKDCYMLEDEDIEGLTGEEISEKYQDYEVSDDVFWTEWY